MGIPTIRKVVKQSELEYRLSEKRFSQQATSLNQLMKNKYTEHKLAAILFLQLFGQGTDPEKILHLVSNWFDQRWINDWNVCDWLCVRVLTPIIDQHPQKAVKAFQLWNKDNYLWKARASLVPFAQCKTIADHKIIIRDLSEVLILREERFCKTAVGWVMREYSKIDENYVHLFLDEFGESTTKEVIRNATKYM